MNYGCHSCRWTVTECTTRPEVLIRSLMDAVVVHLPADSLGHVKGYVAFDGGSVFASSTLIPPGVTVQQTGAYHQGEMRINVTMVFSDLSREEMARALEQAGEKIGQEWNCTLHQVTGATHAS